jgi:hypothetical protein
LDGLVDPRDELAVLVGDRSLLSGVDGALEAAKMGPDRATGAPVLESLSLGAPDSLDL